jgi:hypothetical protein
MTQHRKQPSNWYRDIDPAECRALLARIRRDGPITMHDIDDGVRVEKVHAWASRKPAKRVLQWAFYSGDLTISARHGMLKRYERTDRHFGWPARPKPASAREIDGYRLERALRAQAIVSLDSICHLEAGRKPAIHSLIERELRAKRLLPVAIDGLAGAVYWARPDALDRPPPDVDPDQVHILSPFDPLVIQRKRTEALFDYAHLFEAYVPKAKRKLGYFALPVLVGDRIAAAIDLKTNRAARRLQIQSWVWTPQGRASMDKPLIEAALHRFERFQLGYDEPDAADRGSGAA